MKTPGNGASLCQKAQEYYYALLCHDDAAVPELIARHVEGCSFCRQEVRRLADMLAPTGAPVDPPEGQSDEGAVEALSRQFEFLGEHVRCSHAKAFLPDLLAPSSWIRIPTPITVHVENCPQCTQDLVSISKLGLTAGQLKRLGRFYAQPLVPCPPHDRHVHATAAALAAFSLDEAAPEDLDHVSRCPRCRDRMHQLRAHATAGLPAGTEGRVLLCREISMVDLFDYVLPFGLDDAAVARADGRRDAVVTHVRACRRCMERVQLLHRAIYQIADRADSAVSTLYQCDDGTQAVSEEAKAPECRYPINVQVLQGAPASATAGPLPAGARLEQRSFLRRARPLFRRTAVAAVVLVAAGWLFSLNARIATGMNIGGLVKSVQHAANVHAIRWMGDNPRPIHEMWVSRELDKVVTRTDSECIEYDPRRKLMRVGKPNLGWGVPGKLPQHYADSCTSFIDSYIKGIFSLAHSDGSFSQVDSVPSPDRPDRLLSVYELTRETPGGNGVSVRHRWRICVDSQLQRPVEIECSSWDPLELAWKPVTITRLAYPTTPEMERQFRAMSAVE